MNLYHKFWRTAAWVSVAGFAVAMVIVIVQAHWIALAILAGFAALSVVFLLRDQNAVPPLFIFLFALTGLLDGLGYAWDLYHRPGLFDELCHLFTCFVVALTLAYATYRAVRLHFQDHLLLFALVVASFGVWAGVVWEWLEALLGIIGDRKDTLIDLLMDTLGACIAGVLAAWALRQEDAGEDVLEE